MSIVNTNAVAKVAAVVAGLGLVFASFAPVTRAADSAADLQAQIASLLAQISSLQSQLGTSGSTSAAVMFNADLTLGSTGADVTALQNWLISKGYSIPAGATGYFGAQTQSALAAYQAANGIAPAAGYFGPITRAKVNATAGTGSTGTGSTGTGSTDTSTTLKGGAGDLTVKAITAGTETTVGEGKEEKVLGFEGQADVNSDIEVTSVRVTADLTDANSTRFTRYVDEVVVYLGDKEVGSMDASDFSRSGKVSTGTITLKNAIVRADNKQRFYVAFVAKDVIDSDDFDSSVINVSADRIRYSDATGVILTENPTDVEADVTFEDGSTNDGAKVQSSSNNPDASVLKVKENSTSDEYQVFTFRLRGDSDTSDLSITSLPIKLTIKNAKSSTVQTDDIVSDIYVKVAGEKYDDYDRDSNSSIAGNATEDVVYTFDIDEDDLVIGADDTEDVQVYVKFGKQSGKYDAGSTIKASVTGSEIIAENEEGDDVDVSGTVTGKEHTLSLSSATVDGFTWSVNNVGTLVDFLFTVEADDEDYDVLASSIASTTAGNATVAAGVLTVVTGDAEENTPGVSYTVNSGDTATFMVRYAVSGDNGQYANVKMTSVAGQAVPNAKQLSPTATLNVQN